MRRFFSRCLELIRGQRVNGKRVLISFSLNLKTFNRLKSLQDQSGSENFADLVRDALRIYEYHVLEERMGTKFYTKNKETGKFEPVEIFANSDNEEDDEEDD